MAVAEGIDFTVYACLILTFKMLTKRITALLTGFYNLFCLSPKIKKINYSVIFR